MQKIQRQVNDRLLESCLECGGHVRVVGNGPYRAPKCEDCNWMLTKERAVQMVKESNEFQVV